MRSCFTPLVLVCASLLLCVSNASANPTFDKLMKQKKYAVVVRLSTAALRKNHKDVEAYRAKGLSLSFLGCHKDAISNLNTAIQMSHGQNAALFGDRGFVYGKSGDWSHDIEDCTIMLQSIPKDAWAFWQRSLAHYSLNHYQQAINDCDKAIALSPKNIAAYRLRSWAFSKLKKYDLALKDSKKVLQLEPDAKEALLDCAFSYQKLFKFQDALDVCNLCVAAHPDYARAYLSRAWAFHALGQQINSINDSNKSLELDSNDLRAVGCRARAYWALQDRKAVKDLETFVGFLGPKANEFDYEELANCYGDFNQPQMRLKALSKAISLNKNNSLYYFQRVYCFQQTHQYKKAVQDCNSALFYGFEPSLVYPHRARAYEKLGDYQHSLQDCNRAIELGFLPCFDDIYDIKASILFRLGQPLSAIRAKLEGAYLKSYDFIETRIRFIIYLSQQAS